MWIRIYMRVEGRDQGEIEGESTHEERAKMILCYAVSHDLEVPRDANSGRPAHRPVVVNCPIGAHTPRLFQACCTAEPLEVDIEMYRVNRMGEEEAYIAFRLRDARAVRNVFQPRETTLEETRAPEHVQELSFSYGSITLHYAPTGVETRQAGSGSEPPPGP